MTEPLRITDYYVTCLLLLMCLFHSFGTIVVSLRLLKFT